MFAARRACLLVCRPPSLTRGIMSTNTPNAIWNWGKNKNGSRNKVKEQPKEKEGSLFESIAPKGETQSSMFDAIDMTVEKQELEKTEDSELKKLADEIDSHGVEKTQEAKHEVVITKPEDDAMLMKRIKPQALSAVDAYLGKVRRAVYLQSKTGQSDPLLEGRRFKLKMTRRESALLEPSVWVKSHTQSGSVKKVTPFLRSLRGLTVRKAIAHCHFNSKKVARELEKVLYRGLEQAKELGLKEDGLYIEQCWAGKEPKSRYIVNKMVDFKGRGRSGKLERKEHHVQIVLKTPETKERIAAEKEAKLRRRAVPLTLVNKPIYEKVGKYMW